MSTGEVEASGPLLPAAARSRGSLVAAFIGVDLVVIGLVLAFVADQGMDAGWFAYGAPEGVDPTFFVMTFRRAAGLALAAVGLAVVAGALGYRAGLTRRP